MMKITHTEYCVVCHSTDEGLEVYLSHPLVSQRWQKVYSEHSEFDEPEERSSLGDF